MISGGDEQAPSISFDVLNSGEESSPQELCARLGDELGLDGPVPVAVMHRAIVDDVFASHLLTCQGDVALLRILFSDPRNRRYEEPDDPAGDDDGPPPEASAHAPAAGLPSTPALALKGGLAVAKWGAAGFARVSDDVFETRFAACRRCEYLVDPPDRIAYKVTLRRHSDPRICSACGCVASRKAALPTERCPVADSEDPTLNRWGEPRDPKAGATP